MISVQVTLGLLRDRRSPTITLNLSPWVEDVKPKTDCKPACLQIKSISNFPLFIHAKVPTKVGPALNTIARNFATGFATRQLGE